MKKLPTSVWIREVPSLLNTCVGHVSMEYGLLMIVILIVMWDLYEVVYWRIWSVSLRDIVRWS